MKTCKFCGVVLIPGSNCSISAFNNCVYRCSHCHHIRTKEIQEAKKQGIYVPRTPQTPEEVKAKKAARHKCWYDKNRDQLKERSKRKQANSTDEQRKYRAEYQRNYQRNFTDAQKKARCDDQKRYLARKSAKSSPPAT